MKINEDDVPIVIIFLSGMVVAVTIVVCSCLVEIFR